MRDEIKKESFNKKILKTKLLFYLCKNIKLPWMKLHGYKKEKQTEKIKHSSTQGKDNYDLKAFWVILL